MSEVGLAEQRLLKFVSVERDMPDKRLAEQRREDFREIYGEYAEAKAEEQAGRCSQCGVPYCQTHCPLHNNIPDWLKLTAEGRLREAYELSQATNTFPEICGRICPQDRLCEGNCVIETVGPRHGDDRRGGEVHHRHRMGGRLGPADHRARSSGPRASGSSAPGRAAWRRRISCGARASR